MKEQIEKIEGLVVDLQHEIAVLKTMLPADPSVEPEPIVIPPSGLAAHYLMHDSSCTYKNATSLFYWSQIEPSPGQYNWERVDNWLAQHEKSLLQVYLHTTAMTGGANFHVWQPSGAPVPYKLSSHGKIAIIPCYDISYLRTLQMNMIRAMGARYDGKVTGVIATLGLDGETQLAKPAEGVDWIAACYGTVANAVPHRFATRWIPETLTAYALAFPTTPVFVNMAPGGTDMRRKVALQAEGLGIGLKNSGLWEDANNHWGYNRQGEQPTWEGWDDWPGEIGSWDPMRVFGGQIITESAYGAIYSVEQARDVLLAGLVYHPTAMVWHKEFYEKIPDWLDWSEPYLGVTKATTPGAWWRKRESPYPFQKTSSKGGFSGHLGNFEFWLRREDNMFYLAGGLGITPATLRILHSGTVKLFGKTFAGEGWDSLALSLMPAAFTVTGPVDFVEVRYA